MLYLALYVVIVLCVVGLGSMAVRGDGNDRYRWLAVYALASAIIICTAVGVRLRMGGHL